MLFRPNPTTAAIHRGDVRCFDDLYNRYAPRILNYLQVMTGNRAEAEDLLQETFLAAYQHRSTYKGSAQPLAWLLGIARRRWRDGKRGIKPTMVALSEEIPQEEDVAVRVVRAAHLECSLARLEPTAREAVLLILSEGLTYEEAAEILEQPVGTVKWRVHSATRTLRQMLQAEEKLP